MVGYNYEIKSKLEKLQNYFLFDRIPNIKESVYFNINDWIPQTKSVYITNYIYILQIQIVLKKYSLAFIV